MIKKRSILSGSRLAVSAVAAVLLVLGVILVVQGFIDTHDYRDRIIQAVKEQTGREVNIRGSFMAGRRLAIKGAFTIDGHDLSLDVSTASGATPPPAGATPLSVVLTAPDKSTLQLKGSMDLSAEAPKIQGGLSLDFKDA